MIARFPLALLVVAFLGACARPEATPVAASVAAEPTQAVADLLALADRAARNFGRDGPGQDEARLAAALVSLASQGARPAEPDGDPVPGWRAALPADALSPVRGRVLGPAYRKGMLAGGASVTIMQLFDGGKQARVAIATPGDVPLGIAVLDGDGKAICPNNVGRRGSCNWVPPFSGRHRIIVNNPGGTPMTYYLVID